MYSIYHFFAHLIAHKTQFLSTTQLNDFPFDDTLIGVRNDGLFPDIILRLAPIYTNFDGGELVELKDSRGYTIPSFNSTIPTGEKSIASLLTGKNNQMRDQLEKLGEDIHRIPIRQVFYLIRGQKSGKMKMCLVHGSFFETLNTESLIQQAFEQVLEDRLQTSDIHLTDELKKALLSIFSNQQAFSQTRDVEKASVKLRFRIMTEAKAEANILNTKKYPTILDNTVNFIVPCHHDDEENRHIALLKLAIPQHHFNMLKQFRIKHPLNGEFTVFQIGL